MVSAKRPRKAASAKNERGVLGREMLPKEGHEGGEPGRWKSFGEHMPPTLGLNLKRQTIGGRLFGWDQAVEAPLLKLLSREGW